MGSCGARREKSYPPAASPTLSAVGVFWDPVLAAVGLQKWNEARGGFSGQNYNIMRLGSTLKISLYLGIF